ncbi:roadblock/LC7 domain-containing protein [Catenuloplanes atrovinosus]|uniref:Regulator of Ras-like GTPase activity (Roadblock/LC7/MglB family) n=1 Tax=Catenuloplanes atrovinosus TaxID=137266 RepID=A0AAE4CAV1_9ACTN|nr:roadblock/LC7 domain-containing protein [Catenuloplanes atrovinosus]MDR7276224.1 putative regulator of Ras-like GTPase activity (Roadblock/LC7/MglB family) [Catenuloplanes atrovinosus]
MTAPHDPYHAARTELASLRTQVSGVRGSIISGVDGLLVLHDLLTQAEPHDLAALAAAAYGIGRTCGAALNQGGFSECTVRSQGGYFAVYAIGEMALLAVLGDDGLNVARLHIEARAAAARLATQLNAQAMQQNLL